ncbi:MAG: hypothetical protein VR78_10975 [Hoeflea sp. BRH_c9]|nr:MAG: hypothetical protein VR78_10975 [Hoeflea sp. BRH_c9]
MIKDIEPRLIPLGDALKILDVQKNTYLSAPGNFPPTCRNGPTGNIKMLNLDVLAFALSLGQCKTHREYMKWELAEAEAGR